MKQDCNLFSLQIYLNTAAVQYLNNLKVARADQLLALPIPGDIGGGVARNSHCQLDGLALLNADVIQPLCEARRNHRG